jgi:dynein heavy chain 2
MGSQILKHQMPIMLEKINGFESILKNPKGKKMSGDSTLTWNNPAEIEQYIVEVKRRSNELIAENRKLRKVHDQITETII